MTHRFRVTATFPPVLLSLFVLVLLAAQGCSTRKREAKEEQIRIESPADAKPDSNLVNSIKGNMALGQIPTTPQEVLLTGLDEHRLVTIYKNRRAVAKKNTGDDDDFYGKRSYDYDYESDREEHYMPGLDLLYGYNLLNIAHYDLKTEQLNLLFDQPVLIKSLYYPSFIQDSLYEKPITRNYYLVSVYDADTNLDTLINRKDLRRFYYFDAGAAEKIQLLPADYSAVRSQYDPKNDVMYIFARQDADHDGTAKSKEPLHIFWVSLKTPRVAKRLY